jgi:hypothetical protein
LWDFLSTFLRAARSIGVNAGMTTLTDGVRTLIPRTISQNTRVGCMDLRANSVAPPSILLARGLI